MRLGCLQGWAAGGGCRLDRRPALRPASPGCQAPRPSGRRGAARPPAGRPRKGADAGTDFPRPSTAEELGAGADPAGDRAVETDEESQENHLTDLLEWLVVNGAPAMDPSSCARQPPGSA